MHSVTKTIFPVFAFKVTHTVILLTRFSKLLTRVATLSGGTCLKCLNGTTPLAPRQTKFRGCPRNRLPHFRHKTI